MISPRHMCGNGIGGGNPGRSPQLAPCWAGVAGIGQHLPAAASPMHPTEAGSSVNTAISGDVSAFGPGAAVITSNQASASGRGSRRCEAVAGGGRLGERGRNWLDRAAASDRELRHLSPETCQRTGMDDGNVGHHHRDKRPGVAASRCGRRLGPPGAQLRCAPGGACARGRLRQRQGDGSRPELGTGCRASTGRAPCGSGSGLRDSSSARVITATVGSGELTIA
jgi:hypothetical protein